MIAYDTQPRERRKLEMEKKTHKPDGAPKWFTIKEASAYLSIGEQTLYRWMRDRKITYRKVGDSTRFLKEDLDAFVRIHPSEGDAAGAREFCPVCHNDELVSGDSRSTGLNYFKPKRAKFWKLSTSLLKTEAKMCSACGAVTLFGDVDALRNLSEENAREIKDGA
jgi:excisionase family DNA binding protein